MICDLVHVTNYNTGDLIMNQNISEIIKERLLDIETMHNVIVLFAVESGSRAWGIESADSDYDVRFLYVRPLTNYIDICHPSTYPDTIHLDVPEFDLDIDGWDIRKALALLSKSNVSILEWIDSPIVYVNRSINGIYMRDKLKSIRDNGFNMMSCVSAYYGTANNTFMEHFKNDNPDVSIKKYFYVLRPIFAANYALNHGTNPPMEYGRLLEASIPYLRPGVTSEINRILQLKRELSAEKYMVPKSQILMDYFDNKLEKLQLVRQTIRTDDDKPYDMGRLNAFLRMIVFTNI